MQKLINRILTAVQAGEDVVLCTVIASSGSSPRGAGSRMAVFADGTAYGTVGGGRVECLAIQEAGEVLKTRQTHAHAFCLAPEQVASIGMVCGGAVTIFYQLLTPKDIPILERMQRALAENADYWLYLKAVDGTVEEFCLIDAETAAKEPELYTSRAVLQKGEPMVYTEPINRAGRVYIFGGGHVGRALVPVLANIGFRVAVYDNRKELADLSHFPGAETVIFGDYENIFSKVTLTQQDYVVIMTPAHQADFALLEQVLRCKTRYVGCIGSRHKIARTQEKLRAAGISEEAMAAVHSPIGLPILAETPEEIAISIAGELIQCRAKGR